MKRIITAACLLLASATASAQGSDHFSLGEAYYNRGNYRLAANAFKLAVEADPSDAEAYFSMGNTYRRQGSYSQAVSAYRKAIQAAPTFARAYNNLGDAYDDQAMYAQAITAYRKAISLKPDFVEAYCNLGSIYDERGDYTEAISLFEQALKIDPNYAYAKYGLFAVRHRMSATQAPAAPLLASNTRVESRPIPPRPQTRRPEVSDELDREVPPTQGTLDDEIVVIVQPRPVERRVYPQTNNNVTPAPKAGAGERRVYPPAGTAESQGYTPFIAAGGTGSQKIAPPTENREAKRVLIGDTAAAKPSTPIARPSASTARPTTTSPSTVAPVSKPEQSDNDGRYTKEPILPKPVYTGKEGGRINVDITIDSKGNVIDAKIGDGTDIADENMRKSALEAARKVKFNNSKKTNQHGRITYNYPGSVAEKK
ncbi:MAG: TonB family protein [Tannerellaceae bacterium]|jgi:TonB family protein|nr:TonB family protein [Tannerellaceae bacterium]